MDGTGIPGHSGVQPGTVPWTPLAALRTVRAIVESMPLSRGGWGPYALPKPGQPPVLPTVRIETSGLASRDADLVRRVLALHSLVREGLPGIGEGVWVELGATPGGADADAHRLHLAIDGAGAGDRGPLRRQPLSGSRVRDALDLAIEIFAHAEPLRPDDLLIALRVTASDREPVLSALTRATGAMPVPGRLLQARFAAGDASASASTGPAIEVG